MTEAKTAKPAPAASAAKKARATVDKARNRAGEAIGAGVGAIDGSPLAALAGAIAVGAVAAALIPATRRELSATGPVAERVRGALDHAFQAAKSAGSEELSLRGLTINAATSGIGTLIGGIITAAVAASSAASDAITAPPPPKRRVVAKK